MSYLSTIESYNDYQAMVEDLIASILTGISHQALFTDPSAVINAMHQVNTHYPFVELMYTLNPDGFQTNDSIAATKKGIRILPESTPIDRSQRPYYQLASLQDSIIVTPPYMSTATGHLCVSASLKWKDPKIRVMGYIVIDINLEQIIEFLRGDKTRRKTVSIFRIIYSLMVIGLVTVAGLMLYLAFRDLWELLQLTALKEEYSYKLFSIIIFITLSLAIFDLGKTILEEEVLVHKDIFRHSSTRRTITRFIAAILIAVSIEALLTMFKASLGETEFIRAAVWMMLSVVGLLLGLGGYVYLGAKAEKILISNKMNLRRRIYDRL